MNKLLAISQTFVLAAIAFIYTALYLPTNVFAGETPSFPVCSNPQGEVKVSYESGTHAVVGSSNSYQGKDTVYTYGETGYLQCLCTDSGEGIQTDWWRVSDLTREEIENYREDGWIYVADGSLWGLDNAEYLANNSSFSCGGGGEPTPTPTPAATPTPTPTTVTYQFGGPPVCTATRPSAPVITSIQRNGSTATLTWTKVDLATHYTIAYGTSRDNLEYGVPDTGNVTTYTINGLDPNKTYYYKVYAVNDCMPSEPSSENLGGSVLGLAATGTLPLMTSFLTFGLSSLSLGLVLRKKDRSI